MRIDRLPRRARTALCLALPALVAGIYLTLVSAHISASVVRPGLFAEILVVLYLSSLVSVFQRRRLAAALLTSLVVLVLYTACFAKWLVLRESVSLSDFGSLEELLFTLPRSWIVALVAGLGTIGLLFVVNARRPGLAWASAVLAPLVGYGVCVFALPGAAVSVFETVRPDIHWRPDLNVWRNGPVYTLARELPKSIRAHRQLAKRSAATAGDPRGTIRPTALPASPALSRNLHVILMESFIDPLDFRRVVFPFDPIDPRFRQWMQDGESLALSATFGGQTARAEFEVLCGLPAYGLLGIEFNLMRGATIPCLPNLLRQHGYTTMASVPVPPSFFNVGRAYLGAGFDYRFFARDFDLSDRDGQWLSSAEVFRQTLSREPLAVPQGRPIFNYVVTTSGHGPFDLDPVKRPPVFAGDSWASKVATAVHYNSAAVADFVETLEARDPHAVIVVFGDHLPVLGARLQGFPDGGYARRGGRADLPGFWEPDSPVWLESRATPVVVRRARQSVPVGIVPQFVIPEVILDLLSDGAYCRATDCFSRQTIIYRPREAQAVFTTREAFPQPVCMGGQATHDGRCSAAQRLHDTLQVAYEGMLRDGMGRSTDSPDVPRGLRTLNHDRAPAALRQLP